MEFLPWIESLEVSNCMLHFILATLLNSLNVFLISLLLNLFKVKDLETVRFIKGLF